MKKIVFLLLGSLSALGNVSLPSILNSNMVLQQQTDLTIWGWADPTEKITVSASWESQPISTTCADNAQWRVTLRTPRAGGPYTITIQGYNKIELTNLLIGEVWLCSGQSNMEMTASGGVRDAQVELPTAHNPNIRFFKIPKRTADAPQVDVRGQWVVCDSVTLKYFSAVGYFFGKKLQNTLNVPIGLIDMSWGGSYMDTWLPETVAMLYPETRRSALAMAKVPWAPNKAGVLYNGMVAPITSFPIAGVIWYQGEANRHDAPAYYKLTHALVDTWRGLWQKDFPFYYVQIAPFTYGDKFQTAATRESQTLAMDIPKSGMIVTTDLVDNLKDIHPVYKKEVGNRLANWALTETYGKSVGPYKSPQYRSMQVEGNKIRLTFDHAPNGLVVKGDEVTELEIAGGRSGVFEGAGSGQRQYAGGVGRGSQKPGGRAVCLPRCPGAESFQQRRPASDSVSDGSLGFGINSKRKTLNIARKSMANTYTQLHIHLIFAIQGRHSLVRESFREELEKDISGIVSNKKHRLLAIYCMPDHTHLLIGLNPVEAISSLVRDIKSNSSQFIAEKKWVKGLFRWQEGYGAFSYARSQVEVVIEYIRKQPEHHRKRTFQQEYLSILENFGIEYKKEYLFDWLNEQN